MLPVAEKPVAAVVALTLPPAAMNFNGEKVWGQIEALDFSFIRMKLTHPKHGLKWSEKEAEEGEYWYKRYMFLAAKYPTALLVPNHLIDEFWHQHILDTRMYAKDCQDVFGQFHHHYPYSGMLGEADYNRWMGNVDITKALFKAEFGLDYDRCTSSKCTCYGGCKCRSEMYLFEQAQFGGEPPEYAAYRQRIAPAPH